MGPPSEMPEKPNFGLIGEKGETKILSDAAKGEINHSRGNRRVQKTKRVGRKTIWTHLPKNQPEQSEKEIREKGALSGRDQAQTERRVSTGKQGSLQQIIRGSSERGSDGTVLQRALLLGFS